MPSVTIRHMIKEAQLGALSIHSIVCTLLGCCLDFTTGKACLQLTTAQRPIHPPSTTIVSPLTYELALEAKKTTAPSKSSGLPHLPAGIRSMICRDRVGLAMRASFISVAIYPGAIALTLMPLEAHSFESALVSPATPCLAAA